MNNFPNKLFVIFCVVLFISCSSSDEIVIDESVQTIINNKPIEKKILQLINEYRSENGLSTLSILNAIKTQTHKHTNYMVDKNTISHDFFYKRKEFLIHNVDAIEVGENVAYGYTSAESVVKAWLTSDKHKENIEGDYNYFEVSAAVSSDGKWYFTNIFIKK